MALEDIALDDIAELEPELALDDELDPAEPVFLLLEQAASRAEAGTPIPRPLSTARRLTARSAGLCASFVPGALPAGSTTLTSWLVR
jgi:hypothetical protein